MFGGLSLPPAAHGSGPHLDVIYQLAGTNSKRFRETKDRSQLRLIPAILDVADLNRVQTGHLGESFLTPIPRLA